MLDLEQTRTARISPFFFREVTLAGSYVAFTGPTSTASGSEHFSILDVPTQFVVEGKEGEYTVVEAKGVTFVPSACSLAKAVTESIPHASIGIALGTGVLPLLIGASAGVEFSADMVFLNTAWQTEIVEPYRVSRDRPLVDKELQEQFNRLAATWRTERNTLNSGYAMFTHAAYQRIIGLGPKAIPLILHELEEKLDHWFWALVAIAGEDPVPDEFKGNLEVMRDYWLAWAKRQGYRW